MKNLYSCFLLTLCMHASAQVVPTDSIIEDDIFPVKVYPYLKAEAGFGAMANSVSTSQFIDFVSTDFLEEKDKENLLKTVHNSLRFGYFRELGITYRQPGYKVFDTYKEGQGFGIRNTYYNSANISRDALELVLYGNKRFAGQTAELEGTKYETWYYTSLDYHFDLLLDSVLPIALTVSIHIGHDHNLYHIKTGSFYTDPDGAFLDMDLNYKLRDRENESQAFAGIGVSVGGKTSIEINGKNRLDISVREFGLMNWANGQVLNTDSSFRFKGLQFDNIFDISDSIRTGLRSDYQSEFYYSEIRDYQRLMPFRVKATYRHTTGKQIKISEVFASVNYIYLAGYYPRLTVGAVFNPGRNQKFIPSLSGGGYAIAGIDLAYEIQFARYWTLNLHISNCSGLIVPVLSGGAYGYVGLKYRL